MAKVLVVYLEERFRRTVAGAYFSNIFGRVFWLRYLEIYDVVYVVARAEPDVDLVDPNPDWMIRDARVKFIELPYYKGSRQFLRNFHKVIFAVWAATRIRGVHILRLPGILSSIAFPALLMSRKIYGIELVGDPRNVFSAGGVGGRLSICYKHIFTIATRLACKYANGVAYVTKYTMQKSYPVSSKAYSTFYSSIDLPGEMIVSDRRIRKYANGQSFRIFMAGTMEQRYKGFDVMIKAMGCIASSGYRVKLILAGDGAYKSELEYLARSLGVSNDLVFLGKIPREQVLHEMDLADMYVIPSRTEGLPRVLIEAMARGLPSVGTNVGGIPELLAPSYIVEREDYDSLAVLICNLIDDYVQREAMSEDNIRIAHDYEAGVLRERRVAFYEYLATRDREEQ